jgi:hypothetical protein
MSVTLRVTPEGVFIDLDASPVRIDGRDAVLGKDVLRGIAGVAASVAAAEAAHGLTAEDQARIFAGRGPEDLSPPTPPPLDLTGRRVFVAAFRRNALEPWAVAAAACLNGGALALIADRDPLVTLAVVAASGGKLSGLILDRWGNLEDDARFRWMGLPVARVGLGFHSLADASKRLLGPTSPGDVFKVDAESRAALTSMSWVADANGNKKPATGSPAIGLAVVMAVAATFWDATDVSG